MATPTQRQRAIAHRLSELASPSAVAREFGISSKTVAQTVVRVERYDLAMKTLESDPGNFDALQAAGEIQFPVLRSLQENNIRSLRDLEGMGIDDLMLLPHIGQQTAYVLLRLARHRLRAKSP